MILFTTTNQSSNKSDKTNGENERKRWTVSDWGNITVNQKDTDYKPLFSCFHKDL